MIGIVDSFDGGTKTDNGFGSTVFYVPLNGGVYVVETITSLHMYKYCVS